MKTAINSLNDGQYQAVYSRDSSILVSAPAGSGKTKILINRIMSLIEDDHYNINELLVLTFTKAAALEMKQRLEEELNQELSSHNDEQLKKHLQKQKLLLNDAYITNFHSFCSDLLSQYGLIIGIDNQFDIMENADYIKNKVFDICLAKWVQDEKFMSFFHHHFTDYNFQELKDLIFQLDNIASTIDDFDGYMDMIYDEIYQPIIQDHCYNKTVIGQVMKKILNDAYQQGYCYYQKLNQLCEQYGLQFYFEDSKKLSANHVLFEYYQKLKDILDLDIDQMIQKSAFEIEKHRPASYKGLDIDDDIKDEYKDLLKKAKNTYNETYQKIINPHYEEVSEILTRSWQTFKTLVVYFKKFQEAYQDYKKQLGVLDFNDLERYALKLLEPQYGVSETLYHQLKEIMIDEYQDTNEIQETLILKIATYQEPAIYRFMVGDMKQSIYRFRKADLEIFNQKYLTYSLDKNEAKQTKTRRIDLAFNYRSNKIVLDSINFIFNQIMDTQYGGLEYYSDDSAKLNYDYLRKEGCQNYDEFKTVKQQAIARFNNEHRFDSEVMLVLKSENTNQDMVEYEAKMIVKKINNMVGHLDLDFYKKPTRKAMFQDIAILMRNVGNFITYKKVFDRYHIPNMIILTKGFFDSPEIIDCLAFLKAINNCYDDISLTSVLKGNYAFSHFNENWLYLHKLKNHSMYDSLLEATDQDAINFLNYYHEMIEYAYHHETYQLLEKFLADSQFKTFVAGLYNGQQRVANIELFIEILKNDTDLSLNQIIHKIDETINNHIDYKPAHVADGKNVVTFITIHKSKGLEFPIVFVNQLQHQFNFQDSRDKMIHDRTLGIALNPRKTMDLDEYKDVIVEYPNPIKNVISSILNNETINEEMRILYVALTRASQKLILTGILKSVDQISSWQKKIIDYHCDFSSPMILSPMIRKTNNFLDWVGLSLMRHPDFIKQCYDLSLFDSKITNETDLSLISDNAKKINIYNNDILEDNTMHSKFITSIIDTRTIDEYIYLQHQNHVAINEQQYEYYKNYEYQLDNYLQKTIAVTKIVDDGNRDYSTLQYEDDTNTSFQAHDRGTIIHSVLELLPVKKNINLQDEINILCQQGIYDDQAQKLIMNYYHHLNDFVKSDVYQLMIDSDYLYKEKKFSFVDDSKQIIHGIFDVVSIKDNQITIIDYKTDTVSKNTEESILKSLHQGQMEYYKKILARVFPQAHIQAIVFYLAINRYVIL